MRLPWLLFVTLFALSASLSAAMDASHAGVPEHSHPAMADVTDEQPVCCSESSERSQTCHALAALVPGSAVHLVAREKGVTLAIGAGLLLKGRKPSGSLDPPRAA